MILAAKANDRFFNQSSVLSSLLKIRSACKGIHMTKDNQFASEKEVAAALNTLIGVMQGLDLDGHIESEEVEGFLSCSKVNRKGKIQFKNIRVLTYIA